MEICLDWESRKLRPRRPTANNCSYGCASSSNSTNFCVIPTHMPRSPELGISCPPFQEYSINFFLFTSSSVKATKCLKGSLSPRTNKVGILIGVPQSETSSLLDPLASYGGNGDTSTRHLTLFGRCRRAERAAAPPSECAKITSAWLVLIEEAMRSTAARTEDGESASQNS